MDNFAALYHSMGSYAAANRPTGFGRMAVYGPSSEPTRCDRSG